MTDINLLDHFALFSTQVVKLHAQLHRRVGPEDKLQARVEMKLSPGQLPADNSGATSYQVGVTMSCEGTIGEGDKEEKAFTIECILNAAYRQIQGDTISFEQFSNHHGSLTRQLYPLIHHQLIPVLSQFGLHNVRLPQDIVQTPNPSPKETVNQPVLH